MLHSNPIFQKQIKIQPSPQQLRNPWKIEDASELPCSTIWGESTHDPQRWKSSKMQNSQAFFGTDTINSQRGLHRNACVWSTREFSCMFILSPSLSDAKFSKRRKLGRAEFVVSFFLNKKRGKCKWFISLGKWLFQTPNIHLKPGCLEFHTPSEGNCIRPPSPTYQVTSRHSWVDDNWFFGFSQRCTPFVDGIYKLKRIYTHTIHGTGVYLPTNLPWKINHLWYIYLRFPK